MAEPTKEQTGMLMEGYDNNGRDVVIHSTTGDKATERQFTVAMDQYNKTGQAPEGFAVLPKDSFQDIARQTFNKVSQPIQEAAPKIGAFIGTNIAPVGVLAMLEHYGLIKPGHARALDDSASQAGADIGTSLASQVKTPGQAGMTVGLGLASALASPTTIPTAAGGLALSKIGLLANMAKSGIIGGGLSSLFDAATGAPPSTGKAAVEFGLAAASGGFQSVASHFINKYISPDRQEAVAKGILDTITNKYPELKNDPNLLRAAASSSDNIATVTQVMSKGLRGNLDDVTQNMITDLNATLPRTLSVGEQNTMRAYMRKLNQYGTDFLDNLHDPKKILSINDDFIKTEDAMIAEIKKIFMNNKAVQSNPEAILNILADNRAKLNSFKEGAEVLAFLRQSSAQKGFNPEAFANVIKGEYRSNPGSLLEHVGDVLGQGRPLTSPDAMTQQQVPSLTNEILKFAKNHTPFLKYLPMNEPATTSLMHWRVPTQTPYGVRYGMQAGSESALRDFLGDKQ